jgi:uncharacterized hydrophobic protein (TIGR00341 family)
LYRLEVLSLLGEKEKVLRKAEELGLPVYVDEVISSDGKRIDRFMILVPEKMVDEATKAFMDAVDLRRTENAVIISRIEAWASAKHRFLEHRGAGRLARPLEAVLEEARSLSRPRTSSLVLGALASLIAMAGFTLNNPVLIVGAMLVSPILGPIYGFAVSLVLGRVRDSLGALYHLILLTVVVIGIAAVASMLVREIWGLEPTGEVLARAEPSIVYLAVALLLGGAGAIAAVEGEHEALAGVAIAAALVPPAAAAGMGVGLCLSRVAVGSSLLLAENLLGMMLGSLIALQALGLEPRRYYDRRTARTYLARAIGALTLMMLLLIIILILG